MGVYVHDDVGRNAGADGSDRDLGLRVGRAGETIFADDCFETLDVVGCDEDWDEGEDEGEEQAEVHGGCGRGYSFSRSN